MKVFRIEHREKKVGVYRHYGNECYEILREFTKSELNGKHPLPVNDSKLVMEVEKELFLFISGEFHYGFENLEQLRRWFFCDDIFEPLQKVGFVLRVYDVPKAYFGNTQACFLSEYHEDKYISETIELSTLIQSASIVPSQVIE